MTKLWRVGAILALAGCQGAAARSDAIAEVHIQGADYAFVGVPETLSAGRTAFSYQNIGKVPHEMGISLLLPGRTFDDVVHADERKTPDDSLFANVGGILITVAGETAGGKILLDLQPGRAYLLWCNFRDTTGAKHHSEMGMLGAFTVR